MPVPLPPWWHARIIDFQSKACSFMVILKTECWTLLVSFALAKRRGEPFSSSIFLNSSLSAWMQLQVLQAKAAYHTHVCQVGYILLGVPDRYILDSMHHTSAITHHAYSNLCVTTTILHIAQETVCIAHVKTCTWLPCTMTLYTLLLVSFLVSPFPYAHKQGKSP